LPYSGGGARADGQAERLFGAPNWPPPTSSAQQTLYQKDDPRWLVGFE